MKIKLQLLIFFIMILIYTENPVAEGIKNDATLEKDIESYITKEMRGGNIPGLAIGIIYNNKILLLKGFGEARKNHETITPKSRFVIGSLSKTITGLAIMQLVEDKKIKLENPVDQYLSWWSIDKKELSSKITILNLLNHTSGISAYDGNDSGIETQNTIKDRLISKKTSKLSNKPGEQFEYSSLNYDILGALIEEVTGETYKNYIQNHILAPLNMKNSSASIEMTNDLVTGYRQFFGFKIQSNIKYSDSSLPSGYIISTAEDMTNFLLTQLNEGKLNNERVLSSDGIEITHTSIGNTGYAMGWNIRGNYIFHTGELANYNAYLCLIPKKSVGIIMLANTNDIGTRLINRDSSALKRIPEGIAERLMVGSFPKTTFINTKMLYYIIDLIVILLLPFLIYLFYKSIKHQIVNRKRYSDFIISILIISLSILIPLEIKHFFKADIKALFVSVPDLTIVMIFTNVIIMIGGGIKLTLSIIQTLKWRLKK